MKLRNLFAGRKESASAVQTAPKSRSVTGLMSRYQPLMPPDAQLYRAMREAIPIIDASIDKIVRLIGDFQIKCNDAATKRELEQFLQNVQVGGSSIGINAFLSAYLDQMLMYGTSVGEMVLSGDARQIAALYNAPLDELELVCRDNPFDVVVCRRQLGELVQAPYQRLIMFSALHAEPGRVTGNSLIGGLPFVSNVLMKIYDCIGVNFERMGNLRYAVTYRPSSETADRVSAKERANQIATQWSEAMKSDEVRDFVAVGDVDIKVIGADSQMLSTEIPARQMLEQIVAKTGLPPFLLGLSWSSTERMSSQQADLLTSELEYYRGLLTPVILRICDMWQRLRGEYHTVKVEWEPINLQDEVTMAQARLYRAQAMQIEASLKGERV